MCHCCPGVFVFSRFNTWVLKGPIFILKVLQMYVCICIADCTFRGELTTLTFQRSAHTELLSRLSETLKLRNRWTERKGILEVGAFAFNLLFALCWSTASSHVGFTWLGGISTGWIDTNPDGISAGRKETHHTATRLSPSHYFHAWGDLFWSEQLIVVDGHMARMGLISWTEHELPWKIVLFFSPASLLSFISLGTPWFHCYSWVFFWQHISP